MPHAGTGGAEHLAVRFLWRKEESGQPVVQPVD